jgi:poly(hydroxyalkanoate) depolymerase family esterase
MTRQPFSKLLRPFVALLLAIATIPAVVATSFAEDAKNIEKRFHARPEIPGSGDRDYIIHLPTGYNPAEPLPLVMVLHGCCTHASTIQHDSNFDEVADQERFIVVYPNHKLNPQSGGIPFCWEFWEEAHGNHRGGGDVADLAAIVEEVKKKYKVDENRIHIAGLSSGGGMAVAALVAYPDIFASGSPTAGVPYNLSKADFSQGKYKPVEQIAEEMKAEMDGRMRSVPIFIIQSEADQTVKPQYAEIIRGSWGKAFGVDTQNPIPSPVSDETKGTRWTHTKYAGPDGNTVVETLILHPRPGGGLLHGWYGGRDGDSKKEPCFQSFAFSQAPNTARLAWEFFKAHPLHPAQTPGVHTPR